MSESSGVRILLMEDDPGLARLFVKHLGRHPHKTYHIDVASNGKEGLEMYEAGSYDILLTDQVMPGYTGLQVIRTLKERGPLPPIVMVTGTGSEQIAVEAMKLGASDYIVKDVDGGYLKLLPSVIEQALRQHRLQEEKRQANAERNKLLAAEHEQRLQAETLAEVTLALVSHTSYEDVLEEILHQVQRLVPYDGARIMVLDDDSRPANRHRRRGAVGRVKLSRGRMPPGSDLAVDRSVVESGAPLVIPDTRDDPGSDAYTGETAWIRSHLAVPICLHDRVLGLFQLSSEAAGTFSQEDVDRLTPFTAAAAVALENARLFQEVQRLANIDELTGVYNRRRFLALAEQEIRRARRYERPISLIMLDLDHFKQVNDTYGHTAGDKVLQMLANRCAGSLRDVDVLGRYGGEEFAVLLPETVKAGARQAATRLCKKVAERPFETNRGTVTVTVSLGIASWDKDHFGLETLLHRADKALYAAKRAGRNRVEVWHPH